MRSVVTLITLGVDDLPRARAFTRRLAVGVRSRSPTTSARRTRSTPCWPRRRTRKELDAQLKQRAAAEQVSPSALVRRSLRHTLHAGSEPALTVTQVEEIARRVMRETA